MRELIKKRYRQAYTDRMITPLFVVLKLLALVNIAAGSGGLWGISWLIFLPLYPALAGVMDWLFEKGAE